MDAVTYPHETVVAAIEEGFAPFKINMTERHPDFKEACAGGRVLWGPTFIVADSRGNEVRRWVGWLPPASFVAELDFCRPLAEYNRGKFDEARAGFDALVELVAHLLDDFGVFHDLAYVVVGEEVLFDGFGYALCDLGASSGD